MSLNTEGVLRTNTNTSTDSRHKTKRRSIGLNFTDDSRPHATALNYWANYKLATPLVWFILDELVKKGDDAIPYLGNVPSEQIADDILAELRKNK